MGGGGSGRFCHAPPIPRTRTQNPGPSRLPLGTGLGAPELPRAEGPLLPQARVRGPAVRGRPAPARSPSGAGREARASRLCADADSAETQARALPPRTATHLSPRRPRGPRLRRLGWLGQCLRADGRADGAAPWTRGPRKRPPPARPPAAARPTPAPPPAPRRIPEPAPGGGTPTPRFSAPGQPQAPTRSPAALPGAASRRRARVPLAPHPGGMALMPGPSDSPGSP